MAVYSFYIFDRHSKYRSLSFPCKARSRKTKPNASIVKDGHPNNRRPATQKRARHPVRHPFPRPSTASYRSAKLFPKKMTQN
jgi:hypothetical protein